MELKKSDKPACAMPHPSYTDTPLLLPCWDADLIGSTGRGCQQKKVGDSDARSDSLTPPPYPLGWCRNNLSVIVTV